MTDRTKDRIRLAEAMGIEREKHPLGDAWWSKEKGKYTGLPDPFTSADDDYLVLEWMREQEWYPEKLPQWCFNRPLHSYGKGDNARAALEVIDES